MTQSIDCLDVDVLILGGGLAALRTAIAAERAGATVALVTKGVVGRSGSSAITSAGFTAAIAEADPEDSPQSHLEDTLRGGGGINHHRLVEVFCEEAPARFWEMVTWGVEFEREARGTYRQYASGDHSHTRVALCSQHKGTGMTLPLREQTLGVNELNGVIGVELMTDTNGVSGVLGVDQRTSEPRAVRARSTVLATGGIGQLYPVTSNPKDVTGDGLALAYRAGAVLVDMEFVQFYPWRLISYVKSRMPIQPSSFVAGARLRNAAGDAFMARYDSQRRDATTRDVAARAIYTEIIEGRDIDGGVLLDLASTEIEDFERLNPKVARYFTEHHRDLRSSTLLVAPEAHFLMGGLKVDEHGRTSLPHLFAVGEVCGGVDGGNRLDSNAIPAGQVFGRRAGIAAAADAASRGPVAFDEEAADRLRERLVAVQGRRDLVRTRETKERIKRLMLESAGILRTGERTKVGAIAAAQIAAELEETGANTPSDLNALLELRNMAEVAEIVCTSAEHRTESRAAHFREDYPDPDDAEWLANVHVRRDGDEMLVWKEKAR